MLQGPPCGLENGGGAVDVMVELMPSYIFLPPTHRVLLSVSEGVGGRCRQRTRRRSPGDVHLAVNGGIGGTAARRIRAALPSKWGCNLLGPRWGFTSGSAAGGTLGRGR